MAACAGFPSRIPAGARPCRAGHGGHPMPPVAEICRRSSHRCEWLSSLSQKLQDAGVPELICGARLTQYSAPVGLLRKAHEAHRQPTG